METANLNLSKKEAQARLDQIIAFENEFQIVQQENQLEISQNTLALIQNYHQNIKTQMKQKFDTDSNQKEKSLSRAMKVASLFGAITMATSIFFFFYQIWGNLSEVSQVGILVATPLITLGCGLIIQKFEKTGYFSNIFAFISFSSFVMNLSLLGTIYNLEPTPNAFFVWALYAFLVGFHFKAPLLIVAGILSLGGYLSAQVGTFCGFYWVDFGEKPENFIPAAIIIFALSYIPQIAKTDFAKHFRIWGLIYLFTPLLILSHWGNGSYLDFNNSTIEIIYQVSSFILTGLIALWGTKQLKSEITNTAVTYFIIFTYTKFFDWWWDLMPKSIFFFIISLISILLITIFKRLRNQKQVAK